MKKLRLKIETNLDLEIARRRNDHVRIDDITLIKDQPGITVYILKKV